MKFVPLPTFEELNAMLCGVEALGLLYTLRVEAFSTRRSRDEKSIEATLTHRQGSSSQMQSPECGDAALFGDVVVSPGPSTSNDGTLQRNPSSFPASASALTGGGGGVDERLVLLIAALNAIHGQCEYDFTVLSEGDFKQCEAQQVFDAVSTNLAAVPGQPFGSDGAAFWRVVADSLQPEGGPPPGRSPLDVLTNGSCEYFQFCCPECDPVAQSTAWSAHHFILCKRQRLLVSILQFGEGNEYRGDDPQSYGVGRQSPEGGEFDGRSSWFSTGKNRDFYGV